MIKTIKALFFRYREQILYLLFGALTTLVDWLVSFALYRVWNTTIDAHVFVIHGANLLAWVAAVMFAFVTNRRWVFQSKTRGASAVLGELLAFSGGRVLTFLLQEAVVFVFFDLLLLNKYAVKIAAAVMVVVLNYVISKLLVFRKGAEK